MRDDQQALPQREPKGHEPLFRARVVGIVERKGESIAEDSGGLVEADAVLPEVCGRLVGIPFKVHAGIYAQGSPQI